TMILTNGAGSITPRLPAGEAVLISDHLNLTARSPLVGASFIDLSDLYSARLRAVVQDSVAIEEAVYAQVPGPNYETPAEVRMLRNLGADIVGASTALEAIAAREQEMEVLALSFVTNLAAGIQDGPLSHGEVLAAGAAAESSLGQLLAR